MTHSLDNLKNKISKIEKDLYSIKSEIAKIEGSNNQIETDNKPPVPAQKIQNNNITFKDRPEKIIGKNIELSIGGFVMGLLGAIAIIIAAGWFIKYAIDRHWLNESARIINGIIFGYFFIAGSWYLAKKNYKGLPTVCFGTGVAILYIAVFSGYYFFDLLKTNETFLFLFLLCCGSAAIAYFAKSQFIYIFSLIGAFLAPILLTTGENSYHFLFSYLTIFNIIFLFISKEFKWKVSAYLVLIMNFSVYWAWAEEKLIMSSFLIPFLFINSLLIIFLMRHLFLSKNNAPLHIADRVLLILLVVCYCICGHHIVNIYYKSLLSHFYVLTAAYLIAAYYIFIKNNPTDNYMMETTPLIMISVIPLLLTGITIFGDGPWEITSAIAICGMIPVMAALLKDEALYAISLLSWAILIIVIFVSHTTIYTEHLLFFNERFYIFLISASFLTGAFLLQKDNKKFWIFGYCALFTIMAACLYESHDYFSFNINIRRYSYSIVLLLFALVFLIPGFKLSKAKLRFTGLGIVAIIILKFYFYDIWVMSTIVKIIAGFTLGISLILMAIFYQKLKDKVFKSMFSKTMTTIFLILLFSNVLQAEPVRSKSFKYYKEIPISEDVLEKYSYGKIDLNEDIYKHSYGNDLRIVHNGKGLPYFLRNKSISANKKYKKPKIIFRKRTDKSRIYVLQLPDIPKGAVYSDLPVIVNNSKNYEFNLTISQSNTPDSWSSMGSFQIYSYDGEDKNLVPLSINRNKYIRIESDSEKFLSFNRVYYQPKRFKEYTHTIDPNLIKKSFDDDNNTTNLYFANDESKKFDRVIIEFKEKRFSRYITVYHKENKKYSKLMSGQFSQTSPTEHILQLPSPTINPIKINIHDEDNEPLTISTFTIKGPQEECIFALPKNHNVSSIRLYYGNKYISKPVYDIDTIHEENKSVIALKASAHTVNEDFSYSVLEPPISSWIIRILFLIGFVAVALPSYKIFKNYIFDLNSKSE